MSRPAQDRAAPVGRRILSEARVLQAADQLRECDLRFDACERGAEAEVDAAAEAEVLVVAPRRVEAVGIGKPLAGPGCPKRAPG